MMIDWDSEGTLLGNIAMCVVMFAVFYWFRWRPMWRALEDKTLADVFPWLDDPAKEDQGE